MPSRLQSYLLVRSLSYLLTRQLSHLGSRLLLSSHACLLTRLLSRLHTCLQAAVGAVRNLVDVAAQSLPCQLDLLLAYEVLGERRAKMLYPMNQLRNYALLQVRSVKPSLLHYSQHICTAWV